MYIADLHIHSRYSMATSKFLTPEYLDLWARKKGIHILGTGDFTHPLWRQELKEKLENYKNSLSEEELNRLKQAAKLESYSSYSEFVRRIALKEANRVIKNYPKEER